MKNTFLFKAAAAVVAAAPLFSLAGGRPVVCVGDGEEATAFQRDDATPAHVKVVRVVGKDATLKPEDYGSYAAIVSFILRIERDLPQVALGSLRILPEGSSPDVQRAEIVLEWPVKGAEK